MHCEESASPGSGGCSRRREGEEVAQAPWGPSVCPGQRRALVPHGTTSPSISVFPHGALVPAAPSHPLFVLNPPNPAMSTWIVVSWTHWGPNQICLEQKLLGEKITNPVKAGWQEVAGAPASCAHSQPGMQRSGTSRRWRQSIGQCLTRRQIGRSHV